MEKITGKKKVAAKKEAPKAVKAEKKEVSAAELAQAATVLLAPVVTEKSAKIAGAGQYVFSVALSATKIDVRRAIEAMYNVHVEGVNMIRMPRKAVRFGRFSGKEKMVKKAIVTLRSGETLEAISGV